MSKTEKRKRSLLRRQRRRTARRIQAALSRAAETLEIQGESQVEIEALAPETAGEAPPLPRFSMVAYSGQAMRPGGWAEKVPLVLDTEGLQTDSAGGVIPVHRDHDTSQVVGHSSIVVAEDGRVRIQGIISADNSYAREVVAASKNGFPWQASVGANLGQTEFISEDQTVDVNGRSFTGPIYVARAWTLKEASFVSLGADSRTSGVAAINKKGKDMRFEAWLESKGFVFAELTEDQLVPLRAQYEAEVNGGSVAASEGETQIAASRAATDSTANAGDGAGESTASSDSSLSVAAADHYDRLGWVEQHLDGHRDLQAQAVREAWTQERIQLEALRASYSEAPAIHARESTDISQNAIEARLLMSNGGNEAWALQEYGEQAVEAARELPISAGIQFLIHHVIRATGGYVHAGTMDNDTIRAAFEADRQIQASSGFSTIGLSGTLSNLANKMLLRAYNEIPSVYRRFCRVTSHNDFKEHTKYRVTTPGLLNKIGATGEITHTELDEDVYSNQVETFARMMALTRQMMINDDLGAFNQIPAMFGRMAARSLERSVFSVLLDNTDTFFDDTATLATKGHQPNALAAGAGSELTPESLGLAETLFWNQTDAHGNPIDLVPAVLLVSPSEYRNAVNIVNKTTVNVVGDPATQEQLRVGNEYLGEFQPIRSPYISNDSITGSSETQWWLFPEPSMDVAPIEVAFLRGRQVPVIESAETDFNTLGIQWRSYHDWGVAKQDPRAGIYSPGA